MNTDALIACAEFIAFFGILGVACWIVERRLQAQRKDWAAESGSEPMR